MIIYGVLGIIIGIGVCFYIFRKPIVIKESYSKIDWLTPINIACGLFFVSFVIESCLSNYIIYCLDGNIDKESIIIKKLIENGILIPVFCVIISVIFRFIVSFMKLNRLKSYTANVAKICFSVLIFFMCIKMLILAIRNEENDYVINRIIMWLCAAIGTWMGLGYGCDDSTIKDKIKKIKKTFKNSEKRSFWLSILLILVIYTIVIFSCDIILKNERVLNGISILILCFSISMVISMIICKNIYNPSEKVSVRKFNNLISDNKTIENKRTRFGRMIYYFADGKIYVEEVQIIYKGNEKKKEYRLLFSKDNRKVDDINKIKDYLIKKNNDQKEYIRQEFKKCDEKLYKKE